MAQKRAAKTTILNFFSKKTKDSELETFTDSIETAAQSDPGPSRSPSEASTSTTADFVSVSVNYSENLNRNFAIKTDISAYIELVSIMTNEDKLTALKNVKNPDIRFKFPTQLQKGKNLSFQHKWFLRWNWLAYSEIEDGAFCKFCLLFSKSVGGCGNQPLRSLVKVKYNDWKHATERFIEHEKSLYHRKSVEDAKTMRAISEGKQTSVEQLVNTDLKRKIQDNRKMVSAIVSAIMFCGRQGIALRGHRDFGLIKNVDIEPAENDGNLRALIRNNARYDGELKRLLESCPRNASYISPDFQNEVIQTIGRIIREKLIVEINNSYCFSLMADETADISGTEQMSLCIRFIKFEDKEPTLCEYFLGYIPLYKTTADGISEAILKEIESMGLSVSKIRGQGYDGAAAMSGQFNGVQAKIREIAPTALYVHCSSHSFNLAVSNSCKVQCIRNCMNILGEIYNFFNTPKKQVLLKDCVSRIIPEVRKEKLKNICPTRWIERHDAVTCFLEMEPAVIDALEHITSWQDPVASSNAYKFLNIINQADFCISLLCLHKIFSSSIGLCRFLQTKTIDLSEAVNVAEDLLLEIKAIRENGDEEFNAIYKNALEKANERDFEIKIPRLVSRQTHRNNVPVASAKDYFRITIFIPFLDEFCANLESRFGTHKDILKSFKYLLPLQNWNDETSNTGEEVKHLCEFYTDDIEASQEEMIFEVKLWQRKLLRMDKLPTTAIEALSACDENFYPNIFKLLCILVTLPVTTCEAERSFSTLRRIKSYLRNSTEQLRLNGLALMNVYREMIPEVDEVITELAKKPRKLELRI